MIRVSRFGYITKAEKRSALNQRRLYAGRLGFHVRQRREVKNAEELALSRSNVTMRLASLARDPFCSQTESR